MPASVSLVVPHTATSPSRAIRVLVAHERRWVRAGLRALLERDAGIVVVGEAARPEQVVALGQALAPDVLLIGSAQLAPAPRYGMATLVLEDEHPAALVEAVKRAARRRRIPQLKLIEGGSPWNSGT
jgi:AmiR/NasT family two-component response regulator